MHGLAAEDALKTQAAAIASEFSVRAAVSTADVIQPQQIRSRPPGAIITEQSGKPLAMAETLSLASQHVPHDDTGT